MKFTQALVQTSCATPLGNVTLAASPRGLAGLWFDGQKHLPIELMQTNTQASSPSWPADPGHPVLQEAAKQLKAYFAGQRSTFDLPLDLSAGTEFQQAVWQALLQIPSGSTTSYGALSALIGKPAAVRAVGSAIGRNPVSIIVPCHRVVGSAGALTGYAGGLPRKTSLLQLENAL